MTVAHQRARKPSSNRSRPLSSLIFSFFDNFSTDLPYLQGITRVCGAKSLDQISRFHTGLLIRGRTSQCRSRWCMRPLPSPSSPRPRPPNEPRQYYVLYTPISSQNLLPARASLSRAWRTPRRLRPTWNTSSEALLNDCKLICTVSSTPSAIILDTTYHAWCVG